eukprot:6141180-Pyramimonas_sp.AAC.2
MLAEACSDRLPPVLYHDLSGQVEVQKSKWLSSSAPPLSPTSLYECPLSGGKQYGGGSTA